MIISRNNTFFLWNKKLNPQGITVCSLFVSIDHYSIIWLCGCSVCWSAKQRKRNTVLAGQAGKMLSHSVWWKSRRTALLAHFYVSSCLWWAKLDASLLSQLKSPWSAQSRSNAEDPGNFYTWEIQVLLAWCASEQITAYFRWTMNRSAA